jgi:ribosome maturation factor RimP
MDDYTSNILNDSKNEWSILLINYITPHIIDGFKAIFNESIQLCETNDEIEKYLMTFQNLLSRIPKWNQTIVLAEQDRIIKTCNCSYLEDLITCVHIIQLKILSCVRVGSETKKITIDIPDVSSFIHQIYINIARKLYSNIYLFEIDIPPLEQQRRNREFELIVQTCIMNTIRDKIPVETLLRQFIDETQEIEVTRVEKTLNTTAKSLDENKPIDLQNTQIQQIQQMPQPQIQQIQQMTQPQIQQMPQMTQPQIQQMPQPQMTQIQSRPLNIQNDTESFNSQSYEQRKPSISFNPEPSILEIENNSSIKIDDINETSESINLSFEDLDSNPIKLDFEEL